LKLNIGIQLRKLRNKHNYSQQAVAAYLEISRNAYISWESNKADLTISKLELICDLYNIDLLTLLSHQI